MMKILCGLSCFFIGVNASAEQNYGKGEFKSQTVKLQTVMKDFAKYKGQKIVTEGQVYKVCQETGCWLNLKDGDTSVHVLMKNEGFSVPKDIVGKTVKLEGFMEQKEMPAVIAKIFWKEAGKPQKELDKITGPQKMFEFVADGVQSK